MAEEDIQKYSAFLSQDNLDLYDEYLKKYIKQYGQQRVYVTQAEYDELLSKGETDPELDYYITDSGAFEASQIDYDDTNTPTLKAKDVQEAIEKLAAADSNLGQRIDDLADVASSGAAADVSYNKTIDDLTITNVGQALDELIDNRSIPIPNSYIVSLFNKDDE